MGLCTALRSCRRVTFTQHKKGKRPPPSPAVPCSSGRDLAKEERLVLEKCFPGTAAEPPLAPGSSISWGILDQGARGEALHGQTVVIARDKVRVNALLGPSFICREEETILPKTLGV